MEGLLQHLTVDGSKGYEEPGFEELCACKGSNILAFLEWMGEKWGVGLEGIGRYPGVEGYLVRELGFEDAELEVVRRHLGV